MRAAWAACSALVCHAWQAIDQTLLHCSRFLTTQSCTCRLRRLAPRPPRAPPRACRGRMARAASRPALGCACRTWQRPRHSRWGCSPRQATPQGAQAVAAFCLLCSFLHVQLGGSCRSAWHAVTAPCLPPSLPFPRRSSPCSVPRRCSTRPRWPGTCTPRPSSSCSCRPAPQPRCPAPPAWKVSGCVAVLLALGGA